VIEFSLAPSEVRAMTAGEIKALIRYRNGDPEPDKYAELYEDLKEAKNHERSRNPRS
jgi:hypothetical protein